MKRFFYALGTGAFLAAFAVSQIAAAVSLQASIVVFLLTAAAIAAVAVGCMVRGRKSRALRALTILAGVCLICGLWYVSHQKYREYSDRFAGKDLTVEVSVVSDDGLSSGGYNTYTVKQNGAGYSFRLYSTQKFDCEPYDYVTLDISFFDDADTWLEGSRIAASGFVTQVHGYRSGEPYPPMHYIIKLRDYISRAADSVMGEHADLGKALVLSDDRDMSSMQKDVISGAGVSHIMAVSGFHVTILCALVMSLTSFIRNRRLSIALCLSILIVFMALCGFVPSAVRSVLMIGVSYAGRFINRRTDACNNLGFVIAAMLVYDPLLIYNASFLLSAAGTFAIVALYPPIRMSALTFLFKHVRVRQTGVIRFTVDLVLIGIICAICTLPFTYVLFGEISITSVASNILCLPIMQVTLVLCFLCIGIGCIPGMTALGSLIGGAAGAGLDIFMSFSQMFTRLSRPTDSAVALISFAAGAAALFALNFKRPQSKPRYVITPMLITLGIAVSGTAVSQLQAQINRADDMTEVCFVDVGQGMCSVITDKDSAIVMDCGGSLTPGENAAEYLASTGVRRIECIVISHLDEDHTEGLEALCARYATDKIIIPYLTEDTAMLQSILAAAAIGGAEVETAEQDMSLNTGQLQIDILTQHLNEYKGDNYNSLVCVVRRGGFKALFCGDIDSAAEKTLAELYTDQLEDCTVMSVPHHGSVYSSQEDFAALTSPNISVISVGENNYGHPSPEVVELLEEYGKVYRTDEDGSIQIRTDGRIAEVYELQ